LDVCYSMYGHPVDTVSCLLVLLTYNIDIDSGDVLYIPKFSDLSNSELVLSLFKQFPILIFKFLMRNCNLVTLTFVNSTFPITS
jgi:hypothetical protein